MKKLIVILLCAAVAVSGYVLLGRGSNPDYTSLTRSCLRGTSVSKKQCWEELTRSTIRKYGIDDSLELLARIYNSDPEFANPCHSMTHIIGQAAYFQFMSKKTIPLSDKMAYCSFGFFHGFMETLVARKGTIAQARDFCSYIDKTLHTSVPNVRLACYHGIGHGSTDVHNPKYFGNERALIVPAIANCEAFSVNAEQLKLCVTGVFDSISIAYYNNGANGLVMKKDDPLWLCHEQPEKYKESCYLDMMPAVLWLGDHDLGRTLAIAQRHVEKTYVPLAVQTLAEDYVRFVINVAPMDTGITSCRALSQELSQSCLRGLASGMMQFGKPGEEYIAALGFCTNGLLNPAEKGMCYESVVNYAKQRYSGTKVKDVCTSVPDQYKSHCR